MNIINSVIYPQNINSYKNLSFKSYKESPTTKLKKDRFEFSDALINKELRDTLSSMISCYKEIYNILDQKTPAGIRSLINLSKEFNTNNGLTFKNIGDTNDIISFEPNVLKRNNNNVKIIQKNSSGEIKNSWLIVDNKIAKNYSPQNQIPETIEFYSKNELGKNNIENQLAILLNLLDPTMYKLRKLAIKEQNSHLKPPPATITEKTQKLIERVNRLNEQFSDIEKTMSNKTFLNRSKKAPFYKPIIGQANVTFQNLGTNNNLEMSCNIIKSQKSENLLRLIINKNNEAFTGYLINKNQIIKNFNPKFPTLIPEKFNYVDETEINTEKFSTELDNYLNLYAETMEKFFTYIKPDTTPGEVQKETQNQLLSIYKSLKSLANCFNNINNVEANKIKSNYNNYETIAGKRGYTFKNVGKTNFSFNIMTSNTKHNDNVTKITILDSDSNIIDTIVFQDTKIVNNYNPKYPNILPNTLKFYNQQDIELIESLKYLNDIDHKLKEFNTHVQEKVEQIEKKSQELKQNRIKKQEILKKQQENKNKLNTLSKDFKKDFAQAIEILKDNPNKFLETLDAMKQKVLDLIKEN